MLSAGQAASLAPFQGQFYIGTELGAHCRSLISLLRLVLRYFARARAFQDLEVRFLAVLGEAVPVQSLSADAIKLDLTESAALLAADLQV